MNQEIVKLEVRDGTIGAPVWETEAEARNWAALIYPSVSAQMIRRRFLEHARHDAPAYAVDGIVVGEAIQLEPDRLEDGPRGGRKSKRLPRRWYGVVEKVGVKAVEIRACATPADAFLASGRGKVRRSGRGRSREDLLQAQAKLLQAQLQLGEILGEMDAELGMARLLGRT